MEHSKTTGESYSRTVTNGFLQLGAQQGWQCPICKRVLSPWTTECPCKGNGKVDTYTTTYSSDVATISLHGYTPDNHNETDRDGHTERKYHNPASISNPYVEIKFKNKKKNNK